jgi:ABC-type phosphate/phosphonate transport system substrate-binding protein
MEARRAIMQCNSLAVKILVISLLGLFVQVTSADNTSTSRSSNNAKAAGSKVSYQSLNGALQPSPKVPNSSEYIFSAPPRESVEEGNKIYGPVAEYLSQVTGKKIVYKHPGSWGVYQGAMQHGGYDLVFDGPHFNGWRVSKIQHNMLVKVPGDHTFVALVKKENARIQEIKQLAGYTVCAHAPPNLGTLTLLEQFTNPARQPIILSTDGWKNIYDGLMAGKCAAAVVPLAKLEQFEKNGAKTRVVFRAKPLPDNAFSAGPRLNTEDQAKIVQALLSAEGNSATEAMRQKYAAGKAFTQTTNEEYANLGEFLRNEWGYY